MASSRISMETHSVHCRRRPKSLSPLDLLSSGCSSSTSAFSPETEASSERFLRFVAVVVSLPELSSQTTRFGFMLDIGDCGTKL